MNITSWQLRSSFWPVTRIGNEVRSGQISKQNSGQASWNLFPSSRWPGKGLLGRSRKQPPDNSRGADWPTGTPPGQAEVNSLPDSRCTASQMQPQVVSFPPFQLWNSVRSFISLLLKAKIIKTNWSLKHPFPPQKQKNKTFHFQVAVYPCKVAASGLFSSTLLFVPGSAEVYFSFSKWGILCLRCALPTSLGHGDLGLEACPESLRREAKPSFYRVLPSTHQVSCCAQDKAPGREIIWPWYSKICLTILNAQLWVQSQQQGWECYLQVAQW